VWIFFGRKGLILFLLQSITAFALLELVNYIEHYGLHREKITDEKDGSTHYEPVTPMHSWNADARVTNFFLFKLQRHSDHHAYAGRRYQILRSFADAPQMPTGYGGMVFIALIPPLWFFLMNPMVKAWNEQQKVARKLTPVQNQAEDQDNEEKEM